MPVYNVTIDDASPLVQYDQWWTDSSHTDPFWTNYTDRTFHPTEQFGAAATVTFNGSAVYIFGAKRPNHDVYAVTIDGATTTANGYSGSANINIFNATLFSQTGLDTSEQHQIALQNKYSTSTPAYVDLDYVIITSGDGNASTQSQDTVWDDDHAEYSIGWDTSPNGLQDNYYNQTMHRTNVMNASASVIFTGNAISIYGATSTNHGLFSVSLDSAQPLILNGTTPSYIGIRYQNLLYWAGGLSNGQHNVTIANVDSTFLDLDKFVVSNWSQPDASSTTISSSPTSSSSAASTKAPGDNGGGSTTHHSSSGPVIGGVVAGVVVLALIGLGAFLFYRRRSRRGLDRIQYLRPGNESKGGDVLSAADDPFAIEPFPVVNSVHKRTPLSPSTHAAGPHGASTFDTSTILGTGTSGDVESGYIVASAHAPWPDENPHRDMPPPDYAQATATSSSRRMLPPPPIPNDPPHRKS
ncbi:uncharacterized protein PHACADRAFT_252958 [Phanerochaete carnosa HHB-10118-sp]|uniref:Transmembrane protein n=1 Tax=Phanerochaete carnosa (strain HHB-10118-sp) TaxID=650164 RepID=K5WHF2_PHACS|nr:uncharacterized protein PHACADRAFT_252958 [Phanerochaete carnosa HHB-10118-sp]EKM58539.1 hypothetical protein PHACADRAFT_252958 [Phanerochaete carnosa HHB-10118-sp]